LVKKRWKGLQTLRKTLGDTTLGFQQYGGYELFTETEVYEQCLEKKAEINKLLYPIFNENVFTFYNNTVGFSNIKNNTLYLSKTNNYYRSVFIRKLG